VLDGTVTEGGFAFNVIGLVQIVLNWGLLILISVAGLVTRWSSLAANCRSLVNSSSKIMLAGDLVYTRPSFNHLKVVVPSPDTLSWDACSMTHLETHSQMHLKLIQCIDRRRTRYKSRMGTTTLLMAFSVRNTNYELIH
jgi:hypothetical protein